MCNALNPPMRRVDLFAKSGILDFAWYDLYFYTSYIIHHTVRIFWEVAKR